MAVPATPSSTDGYGLACRVVLWSNILFGAVTNVTVELSTPVFASPDSAHTPATTLQHFLSFLRPSRHTQPRSPLLHAGMLFCFTTPGLAVTPDVFAMPSLLQGGGQFAPFSEVEQVAAPGGELAAQPFFSAVAATWGVNPAEPGTAADVLASDPFYAQSFLRARYDDFVADAAGASLAGVHQPATAWQGGPGQPFPRSSVGNCVALTGQWRPATRYAVTLTVRNPTAAAVAAAGGSAGAAAAGVWMAPLSLSRPDSVNLAFAVRGDKYGRVCPALDPGRAALSSTSNLTPPPPAPACDPATSVPSARYPSSTCVVCGQGAVAASGQACFCPASALPALAGSDGCGPPRGARATTVSRAALLAELCADFAAERGSVLAGTSSDAAGARLYPSLFLERARSVVDWAALAVLNSSYVKGYMSDERRSGAGSATLAPPFAVPGRQASGLLAGCGSPGCRPGATFVDAVSKSTFPVRDNRFAATQGLRLVGYVLSQLGGACPELFDPGNPGAPSYGPYNEAACAAL